MPKVTVKIDYISGKTLTSVIDLYDSNEANPLNTGLVKELADYKKGVGSDERFKSWSIIGTAPAFDVHLTPTSVAEAASDIGKWLLVTIVLGTIAIVIGMVFQNFRS